MKKNVVFIICVKSKHEYLHNKHGGFKYFEYSVNTGNIGVKRIT